MTTVQQDQTLTEYDTFIQGLRQPQIQLVACDTETTGLKVSKGEDYLQGLSLAFRAGGIMYSKYFPFRHSVGFNLPMDYARELISILNDKVLIFHNRKFDFHSIDTLGIPFKFKAYDTMLMAHMLNENSPYEKSLENCAQKYIKKGKTDGDKMKALTDAIGWENIPSELMAPYAAGDAEVTYELYEKLMELLRRKFGKDLNELWDWDERMNDALYSMEHIGVHVDQKFCRQYSAIAEIEMAEIEEELGFQPSKTSQLSKFLFDELKLPILEYTPSGRPKMDKNVMEQYETILADTDDNRARLVLNFRGWQKANSAFYVPFQYLADPTGAIHCNYKQHGTVTSRLSCAEPNLQQIPRESEKVWNGKIRSAFHARPGFGLFGFDYDQLEFRMAAAYGQEQWLMDGFRTREFDPFTDLSGRINTSRQDAKTFTYSMIYGAGEDKVAKTMHKTTLENSPAYQAFLSSVPGIVRAKKLTEQKVRQRGYLRYWTGRRRNLYPDDAYKGFNALLQGGGAEVTKRAMVRVFEEVCDENCVLLLQVHDELVFEIRDGMYDDYAPRIMGIMYEVPTNVFDLPFTVGSKQWGEAA